MRIAALFLIILSIGFIGCKAAKLANTVVICSQAETIELNAIKIKK